MLKKKNHSQSIEFLPDTSTIDWVDTGSNEDSLLMWDVVKKIYFVRLLFTYFEEQAVG